MTSARPSPVQAGAALHSEGAALKLEQKEVNVMASMTNREKKERAQVRKELRAQGVLPPKKKPLNRKQFIAEARGVLKEGNFYEDALYYVWALAEMLGHTTDFRPDLQAVGAAKVILLAKERKIFEQQKKGEGKESWTLGEMAEAMIHLYQA